MRSVDILQDGVRDELTLYCNRQKCAFAENTLFPIIVKGEDLDAKIWVAHSNKRTIIPRRDRVATKKTLVQVKACLRLVRNEVRTHENCTPQSFRHINHIGTSQIQVPRCPDHQHRRPRNLVREIGAHSNRIFEGDLPRVPTPVEWKFQNRSLQHRKYNEESWTLEGEQYRTCHVNAPYLNSLETSRQCST